MAGATPLPGARSFSVGGAYLLSTEKVLESSASGVVSAVASSQGFDVVGVCGLGVRRVDRPLAGHQTALGNLRRPQTEFVGDLADLRRRIAALRDVRLVTLTGSGGVGKSRAATEIGLLVDDFPGGVWMCELAPITDPGAIVLAAIESNGATPQAGLTGVDVIVDWCHDRRVPSPRASCHRDGFRDR